MTSAEPSPAPLLDRRARILLPIFLLLLLVVSVHRYGQTPPRHLYAIRGAALGTTWELKLAVDALPPAQELAIADLVSERLNRVDRLMSTWRPDSEVSRFNASPAGVAAMFSPETRGVLELSQEISRLSGGAFDVTVDPLVALWGFGAGARGGWEPPAEDRIRATRERVGAGRLSRDAEGRYRKDRDDVRIDLSAVAKGYAVDLVVEGLEVLGQAGFLFELGGELAGRGGHTDGSPWRVAIELPSDEGRAIHRIVALRDLAMATSGDYRNAYEYEGRRYSHTIDPRSGRPVAHGLASVTVLASEAARADALATALSVLGPEEGPALARREGIAAYFITRVPEGAGGRPEEAFQVTISPAFEPYLVALP